MKCRAPARWAGADDAFGDADLTWPCPLPNVSSYPERAIAGQALVPGVSYLPLNRSGPSVGHPALGGSGEGRVGTL
jgi:hypothetical protein